MSDLALEDATYKQFRKVGKKLQLLAA